MLKLPTTLLAITLTSALTLVLTGCGNSGSQQSPSQTAKRAPAEPTDVQAVVPASAPAEHQASSATSAVTTSTTAAAVPRERKLADGLIIKDIKIGTGAAAIDGETAIVRYTGMLMNGKVFDASSLHGNQPFPFQLGAGQVIQGWEIGVKGMHVGGIRELIIPPELAYGAQSPPGSGIPDNSTLKFRVQLLGVQ